MRSRYAGFLQRTPGLSQAVDRASLPRRPTLTGWGEARRALPHVSGDVPNAERNCLVQIPIHDAAGRRRATTVAVGGAAVLALSATAPWPPPRSRPPRPTAPPARSPSAAWPTSPPSATGTADPVSCQRPAPDNRVRRRSTATRPTRSGRSTDFDLLTPETTRARDRPSCSSTPTAPRPAPRTWPSSRRRSTGRPGLRGGVPWAGRTTRTRPAGQWTSVRPPPTAGPERPRPTSSGPTPSPRRRHRPAGDASAETQGIQGLSNLMKAIDWGIDQYPSGTVFSMSFGTNEAAFASPAAAKNAFARFDQTFIRARPRGTPLLQRRRRWLGRRDPGAQADRHGPRPGGQLPERLPYVTSVGGTQVQSGWTWNPTQDKPFNDDGSRNPLYWAWTTSGSSEAVWNELGASIATGGGLSTVYPRPAYQDLGRQRRRYSPRRPGRRVERGGQRRRARLLVVLPAHQRQSASGASTAGPRPRRRRSRR